MTTRHAPLALCALLFISPAWGDDAEPQRSGYAFDYPRVLAQQRIFGVAHGIALLAAACRETHTSASEAYAAWRAKQKPAIDAATADLARYYFGDARADGRVIAKALRLREALEDGPDEELKAACDTLPDALAQARYDLGARFRLEERMKQVVAAFEVDALHEHCRKEFTASERSVHEARYRLWREINDADADAAANALEGEWPVDAPAASYAEWIASMKKEARAGGGRSACLEFSAWLKRPESFLRNIFRMPRSAAEPK